MEYEVKEKTSSKIVFDVRESREEILSAKQKAYSTLVKKVKVPGFRHGKAPYEIGASFVGEERITEEALEYLIDKDMDEIFKKENIYPLSRPDVHVNELKEDLINYSVSVEFLPDLDIDIEKRFEIPVKIEVREDEVNSKLNELQDSFTELTPVDREIQSGDIVEVSYETEGKEPAPFTVTAGKDKVIGDFAEKIIGKKISDKFIIKTENSEVPFTVLSIKEKKAPSLDDILAKEAGFETLDALKEEIRKQIKQNKSAQAEENRGHEVLRIISESLEVELPKKFIEESIEERYKDVEEKYLKRGKKIEDVLKEENRTIDDYKAEIRKVIENELREDLVIRDIIKKKNITVSNDEVESEFNRIVTEEGLQNRKVTLTDELKHYIRQELLRSKAILILKENAIIIYGGD